MDKRIVKLLSESKTMTICTIVDDQPHCAICYYAFYKLDTEHAYLLFKSSDDTQHIKEALANPKVAGSVLPNREMSVASNQGIQYKGEFVSEKSTLKPMVKQYEKKFPMSIAVSGTIWGIALSSIKMTDNNLGFGKKLKWEKRCNSVL